MFTYYYVARKLYIHACIAGERERERGVDMLTREVEEVGEEEAVFMESLKLRDVALLQVSP